MRHAPAETLFDLRQRAIGFLHDIMKNSGRDDLLVIRHGSQNLRHLQGVQNEGNGLELADLPLVHDRRVDDRFLQYIHHLSQILLSGTISRAVQAYPFPVYHPCCFPEKPHNSPSVNARFSAVSI